MNIYVFLFLGFVFYLIKGIIWIIIDIQIVKNEYNNVIQAVANILLWPLFSLKYTITLIKKYIIK